MCGNGKVLDTEGLLRVNCAELTVIEEVGDDV